jgi:hypothetical protein
LSAIVREGALILPRRQAFLRERVTAAIDRKLAAGMKPAEAVSDTFARPLSPR